VETVQILLQILIALGIFNVWVLRYSRPTDWRGGNAESMPEEFAAYGLPQWTVPAVGVLKLLFAALLLVGIWIPEIVAPAATGIAVLMLGAVLMHIRIKDPLRKSLPAFNLLVLATLVAAI
jgi:hypothetical protein